MCSAFHGQCIVDNARNSSKKLPDSTIESQVAGNAAVTVAHESEAQVRPELPRSLALQ